MFKSISVLALLTLCATGAFADQVEIQVRNYYFYVVSGVPGTGTNKCVIRVGDTVRWTWAGNFHSVTADDISFDSGLQNTGFIFMNTFPNAGDIGYYCYVHGSPGEGMYGTIAVDNVPTDIHLSNNSVAEHTPNGTVIGTFTTVDLDANDTFVYILTDDAGGRFSVNNDQLVVANSALLDHTASPTQTIRVRSTDRGGSGYSVETTFTIQVLPSCPGDINGDHAVDLADLSVLLSHFGASGGATQSDGDINGDARVDLSDLTLLLSHFGTTCP